MPYLLAIASLFRDNIRQFHASNDVVSAGPRID